MSYITSNQGRPIQGVSQQPEKTRLPGQCTLSENLRPDVVRGLINRQGTESASTLNDAPLTSGSKWHHYSRGTGEEYFISIEKGTGKVRVWSPNGTEHIVNVEDNSENVYLASPQPTRTLKMLTIGDYTFIVNTTKTVWIDAQNAPASTNTAIIYIQFADYGQNIIISINDFWIGTITTADGGSADDKYGITPTFLIHKVNQMLLGFSGLEHRTKWTSNIPAYDLANPSAKFHEVFNWSVHNNTIWINRKNGASFTTQLTDDADNANSVIINGKIDNTTLLPGTAPEGFVVEVDPPGSTTSENSNYWLKAINTNSDHITWRETIAPGISLGAYKSSMPHVLVRESINAGIATFTLRVGEWSDREVGNDNTNPHPTFINVESPQMIQSIGIFQNRLFLTSGEAVIMSRSGDFFNFYRETAQAALDTDPIDVFSDVAKVNFLDASIYFDGDLVFFSNQGQFILDGSHPITRDNATLRQATTYEAQLSVDPVASGDAIFFAFDYGQFTGVREFFTDSITDTKKARPVTDHVKKYIEGNPTLMATSTNLNMLVIKTDHDDHILYVYDWLWQGADKVQSSWGKIVFPIEDKILFYEFSEATLWLVMLRGSKIVIETMDLGDPADEVTGYPIRLDMRVEIIMYHHTGGTWTGNDPYPEIPVKELVMVRKTGAFPADVGTAVDFFRDGLFLTTNEEMNDDFSNVTVTLGRKYYCKYSPTNPVALDENGYALSLDRLTIGSFYMNYNTTGELTATISSDNTSSRTYNYATVTLNDVTTRTYNYDNRTLGGVENLVGFAPLVDGQHRVPIRQKSDRYQLTFETSSHLPLEVRDFEYNGNLSRRGRRL
jgi:hypothetical protein